MSRQPRIPGTSNRRVLYLLPPIHDDLPSELKNAIALRNSCTVEGECPACGATREVTRLAPLVYIASFEHEASCAALLAELVS
jgi:hypothetical protein